MRKFRISSLMKSELDAAMEEANLTTLQHNIIVLLNKEELADDGIMQKLHVSRNKYYAEKRIAVRKIKYIFEKKP